MVDLKQQIFYIINLKLQKYSKIDVKQQKHSITNHINTL